MDKKFTNRFLSITVGMLFLFCLSISIFAASPETTTVTLYRRLAGNVPVLVETVEVTGTEYTFDKTKKQLFTDWHLSSNQYVFIGWFHQDADGLTGKWTGDGTVPLKPGENNSYIAVFNVRPGMESSVAAITAYTQFGDKTPVVRERTKDGNPYMLPDQATMEKNWKIVPTKYTFTGWHYANEAGRPEEAIQGSSVCSEPGNVLRIVAVYSNYVAPVTIGDEKTPLGALPVGVPVSRPLESTKSPFSPNNQIPRSAQIVLSLLGGLLVIWLIIGIVRAKRND